MRSNTTEPTVMSQRLSPERLGPYLAAGGGDPAVALDLYLWNAEMSAALGTTIGHVEVLLRNAIHHNLTAWSARRFGEPCWYRDPGRLLRARESEKIFEAQLRIRHTGHVETPGRVVAELSFGFWRALLAGPYDATLWRQTLYQAFPGQRRRRAIQSAVEVLHLSRNRIAHLEPMFNRPVEDIHATALEVAGWICPVSKGWIARNSLTVGALRRRPSVR